MTRRLPGWRRGISAPTRGSCLGHSWGSDLAVCHALDHARRIDAVVGIAGHGLHRDRDWSAACEAGRATQESIPIDFLPAVHAALWASFKEWIHEPALWRRLADCPVPMTFIAAENDIRPSWPLRQLAELVPDTSYDVVESVAHDFWFTHPQVWRDVCTQACGRAKWTSGRVDHRVRKPMRDDPDLTAQQVPPGVSPESWLQRRRPGLRIRGARRQRP